MASVFLRWSLFGAVITSPAFSLTLTCDERTMDYNNDGGIGMTTVIECMADEDIYFSNGSAAILTTAVDPPWKNPIPLPDGPVLPAPSWQWSRNFALHCGSASFSGEPPDRWPTDYLFVSDPVDNPFDPVMAAFGAYLNKTAYVARKLGFVFFPELQFGKDPHARPMTFPIPKDTWAACVQNGTAKLVVTGDSSPGGNFYAMVDKVGNPIAGVEAIITKQDLAFGCSQNTAATIKTAFEGLRVGLTGATSESELNSLKATVQGIRCHKTFASCYALMKTFYDEELAPVTLHGSKVCRHASNAAEWNTDPCCNPVLRWSQCCAAGTITVNAKKCVEVNGGGQCEVNTSAMNMCSAVGKTVMTFVIQEIVAPSIFETNHPQYGCSIEAAEVAGEKQWQQARRWVDTCESAVRDGKNKLGTHTCEQNADCFTSCKDDRGNKRCERAIGSGGILPSFRCMLSQVKSLPVVTHVGALIGATIGDGIGEINEDTSEGDSLFVSAYNQFKTLATEVNCGGETAPAGWCSNSLTKVQCDKLALTEGSGYGSYETAVKWIDDPSSSDPTVGWCVMANMHIVPTVCSSVQVCGWGYTWAHRPDSEANQACNTAMGLMHACLLNSGSRQSTQSSCESNGGTWINYGTGEFHRLQSITTWGRDPTTGNHKKFIVQGDASKCVAEKACNWDPWGHKNANSEALCIGASAPESIPGTGANAGKKMFCGRCDTPTQCGESMMSVPTCVVRPWDFQTETSADSGLCAETGQQGGLGPATYDQSSWESRGQLVHSRCYRSGAAFDTLQECMPTAICPAPVSEEGRVYNDCSTSFCYDDNKTIDTCQPAGGLRFWWQPNMANGTGLCRAGGSWMGMDKATCEGASYKWWEGRAWVDGWMVTQSACEIGHCQDDKPGSQFRTTCNSSNICTKRCEVCQSDRRYDGGGVDRMCYNDVTTSQACTAAGFEWDSVAEKCKKTGFNGVEADCKALDAAYTYKDCSMLEPAKCKAGCKLAAFTDHQQCYAGNLLRADGSRAWPSFDWKERTCMVSNGVETEAQCTGIRNRTGGPEWTVTDAEAQKIKNALQCRWESYGECPDQASCENAGECEDWELEHTGSCIKDLEPNARGERTDCYDQTPSLHWAGDFGCKDISVTNETACLAKNTGNVSGWLWLKKASTRATCDAHGSICRDRFRDWKVFGGFTSESDCLACGDRVYAKKAGYRGGRWQKPAMKRGLWKAREWASKNSWEPMLSRDKLEEFADMAMSKMVGEVYTTEITCLLAPLTDPLLLTACACGTGTSAECASLLSEASSVLEIPLAETTLDCQTVSSSPPVEVAAGKIQYDNASCAGQANTVLEKVSKVAVSSASTRRLSSEEARRLSTCAAHAIITDANGGTVGQKMGPGLSSQTNGASFCITPNVPSNEVCTQYTVNDFANVAANGAVGSPLGISTTIDQQGRYCGTMPSAGTFMPIKRLPDPATGTTTTTTQGATTTTTTATATKGATTTTTTSTATQGASAGQSTSVEGSLTVSVSDAAALATEAAKPALKQAIADVLDNITVDMVEILDVTIATRRLQKTVGWRRLSGAVQINYRILIPAETNVIIPTTAQMQAKQTALVSSLSTRLTENGINNVVVNNVVANPVSHSIIGPTTTTAIATANTGTGTTMSGQPSTADSTVDAAISPRIVCAWLLGAVGALQLQ